MQIEGFLSMHNLKTLWSRLLQEKSFLKLHAHGILLKIHVFSFLFFSGSSFVVTNLFSHWKYLFCFQEKRLCCKYSYYISNVFIENTFSTQGCSLIKTIPLHLWRWPLIETCQTLTSVRWRGMVLIRLPGLHRTLSKIWLWSSLTIHKFQIELRFLPVMQLGDKG